MILRAYLDESGTHSGSPVTIMGGVLATALKWSRFASEFRKIKKRHGFKIFHTKKFKNKTGDFSGWSTDRCMNLIYDLAALTSNAFTEGVTMTLDNETYEAEYRSGEKPNKLRLDSKYGLAFRQCLLFFILEGEKRTHKGRFPTLHLVLESGHANAGDAVRIFDEMKKELKILDCDMLGTITFAQKNECDPLMMADFIAHTTFTSQIKSRAGGRGLNATPVPKGQSGVTHLQFHPGGLANIKEQLIGRLRKSRTNPSESSTEGPK